MSLTGKVESETEIEATAAKFYNVFRKQLEHLPNISPDIHGNRVHEGDWENVGSVKHWEFTIGMSIYLKFKTCLFVFVSIYVFIFLINQL